MQRTNQQKVQERATNRLFDQNYQDSPLEVSNYFTNARNKEQLQSEDRPLTTRSIDRT